MKITPLEIRQKTFEKGFRGYEKDEVSAYLQSLSQEWERLMDENKEYNMKIDSLQKEVDKLREVENSLFKTLKTAEDTGTNLVEQAKKTAELHMRETEINAEGMLSDAKNKARDLIDESEIHAKQTIDEMEAQLKNLMHSYKTLENFRDDLIADIKGMSTDALERVERLKNQIKRTDIESHFFKSRREGQKFVDDKIVENTKTKKEKLEVNISVEKEGIATQPKENRRKTENKTEEIVEESVSSESDTEASTSIEIQKEKPQEEPSKEKAQEPEEKKESSFFDEIE